MNSHKRAAIAALVLVVATQGASPLTQNYFTREENSTAVIVNGINLQLADADQGKVFDPNRDLLAYADTVTIGASLTLPHRVLVITARKIVCNADVCRISVSGGSPAVDYSSSAPAADGANNGDKGSDGAAASDGFPGGIISIVANELAGGKIVLAADGGNGGVGQSGGNGHVGGPGQDVDPDSWPCPIGGGFLDGYTGGTGQRGGDAGRGGRSGSGGSAGSITIALPTGVAAPETSVQGGVAGTPSNNGSPGAGGPGGLGGWCGLAPCPVCQCRRCGGDRTGPQGAAGESGSQAAPVDVGSNGIGGAVQSTTLNEDVFATISDSVSQRLPRMILQESRRLYLSAKFQEAKKLLEFASLFSKSSDISIQASGLEAVRLLSQLSLGLDYYGKPRYYTPVVGLKTVQELATDLLKVGSDLEKNYEQYFAAESAVDARIQALNQAIASTQIYMQKLQNQKASVVDAISKKKSRLNRLADERNQRQLDLQGAADELKIAIERKLEAEAGLKGFLEFLNLVKTVVSVAVGDYGKVLEIVDALKDVPAMISSVPALIDGIPKVVKVAETGQEIIKSYSEIKEAFGSEGSEGNIPDSAKVLVSDEAWNSFIQPYLGLSEGKDYSAKLQAFKNVSDLVNHELLEYSALYAEQSQIDLEFSRKQASLAQTSAAISQTSDPGLATFVEFMSEAYGDIRNKLLRVLYDEYSVFRYSLLSEGVFNLQDQNMALLQQTEADLRVQIYDALKNVGRTPQSFSGSPFVFKVDNSTLPSYFVENISKKSSISFSIPLDLPIFKGFTSVIVSKVRVWVDGVKFSDSNSILKLRLTHSGQAQFLDHNLKFWEFQHDYRVTSFVYDLKSKQVLVDGDLGAGSDGVYIGLSPFTFWTVELPGEENPGMDFSVVSSISLEFWGTFLPPNQLVLIE